MPLLTTTDLGQLASETAKGVDSGALLDTIVFRDEVTLVVDKRFIKLILRALREHPQLAINQLSDVTAIDYLELGRVPRFDVVYHLNSLVHFHRIRLRAPVEEEESQCEIDSICELWGGASYMERE